MARGSQKRLKPGELWTLFEAYYRDLKANPKNIQDFVGKDGKEVTRTKERPPTLQGFYNYVREKTGHRAVNEYFMNRFGSYENFIDEAASIRNAIAADQLEGSMIGIYSAQIVARLQLSDRPEQEAAKIEQPLFPEITFNLGDGKEIIKHEDPNKK